MDFDSAFRESRVAIGSPARKLCRSARQSSQGQRSLPLLVGLVLCFGASLGPLSARAAVVVKNDPSLPASLDGNNLTEDTVTGLQWLDVTVTADRTFDDIIGNDGTNEFLPGGDFEGFRHATYDELTGWNAGPQRDSLFINYGFNSVFSSISTYAWVRPFLLDLGCHGSCALYGRLNGIFAKNTDPSDPEFAEIEAFSFQGVRWGSLGTAATDVFLARFPNELDVHTGHFLVRAVPPEVPVTGWPGVFLLCALLVGMGSRAILRIKSEA